MTTASPADTAVLPSADRPACRPTVCHVIHALDVGGAEVLVDRMVRHLSGRFRCLVAVLDAVGQIGERLRQDGFTVEHLHRGPGIDLACARRLRHLVRQHHVSLLHAHQYTPFLQAMLSRGLSGQVPVLLTEHGRHVPDLPSLKRKIVNRLLLKPQDRLVGCGEAVRQALIDNEGLPAGRVEVVYNGMDLEHSGTMSSDTRVSVRAECGFQQDDFVVVQVARLHALKDHQTALRAVDRARREQPRIRLLIVGDGDERTAIEQTVAERNLHEHVRLVGTRTDVPRLLEAADVFLLTSISEGIPLTVIEAMAAARPVVATRVGGLPEMVEHGVTGFLCEPRNDRAVASRLVELALVPERGHLMGRAGRITAERRFSLQQMLRTYAEIYEQMTGVVDGRNRKPSEASW